MLEVEEKMCRLVRTGLARHMWVFPRSVGRVGGASELDVGILTGLFGDIWALIYHRCVRCSPSPW